MSDSGDFDALSSLANRLRDATAPLDQRLEALGELERRLATAPAYEVDPIESKGQLARAALLARMTRLGAPPELDALDTMLDPSHMQQLRALCEQPISAPLVAEITRVLNDVTTAAQNAGSQLKRVQAEVERLRYHRAVLQDMLDLMAILAGDGSELQPRKAT